MTVIHAAALAAVQLQPLAAVTFSVPVPPLAAAETVVGETAKEQATPAWVTVTTVPAMVAVPVRAVVAVLGAMV